MIYLVKDIDDELVDVLDSENTDIKEYKEKHPEYSIIPENSEITDFSWEDF